MTRHRQALGPVLAAALLTALGAPAHAESSSQLGLIEDLLPETEVFVDVVNAVTENIQYTGNQDATVFRPDGSLLGVFPSGSLINPDQAGPYRFTFTSRNSWTIEIAGRSGGRVWSQDWRAEGPGFGLDAAFNFDTFAVVDGGAEDRAAVVRLNGRGTNAFVFRVTASETGLFTSSGRSVPDRGQAYAGQYRVYLEEPEIFTSDPIDALVSNTTVTFEGPLCGSVAPNRAEATITFEASADGVFRLVCDLNRDGVFNFVEGDELVRRGSAVSGTNTVFFDGTGREGERLPVGEYECVVHLAVGEMHFAIKDVETVYPGLRLYESESSTVDRPLRMFWDDTEVQPNDVLMPNDQPSLVTSGADGMLSAPITATPTPNVDGRAWGRFTFNSKGNKAWMDTYTFVSDDFGDPFTVSVLDGRVDTDGDTLSDVEEDCFHGTDPTLPDTDGDGLDDALEVNGPSNPLNPDTDGDGRGDASEVNIVDGTSPDTDGDGIRDVRDVDDDNDGILTIEENREGALDDFDNDGTPNHQDRDSDADGYSDAAEGTGDRDNDGNPDFLDPDTVGVGEVFGDPYYAGGCSTSGAAPGVVVGLFGLLALRRRRTSVRPG